MTDKKKIKRMDDANWTPAVIYWKDKCDTLSAQLEATIKRIEKLEGEIIKYNFDSSR